MRFTGAIGADYNRYSNESLRHLHSPPGGARVHTLHQDAAAEVGSMARFSLLFFLGLGTLHWQSSLEDSSAY